jgi:hypothetical protein
MLRLDHLGVMPHRQTLGITQSLLELGRELVEAHGNLPSNFGERYGDCGMDFNDTQITGEYAILDLNQDTEMPVRKNLIHFVYR